ncbi:MAG: MFS transporter [Thermomicrobiales bacterium]
MTPSPQKARRSLWALVGADSLSRLGDIITLTAIPWFVLETTGSASKTGLTVFAGALAVVISLFFGGAVVDRIGYRSASIVGDLASGATVALIATLHLTVGLPFWLLVSLVFTGTLLDLPAQVARYSVLPDAADLAGIPFERANAMLEAGITGGALLGPALAGILIATLGAANVLWFDVGTFLFSALLVATGLPGTLKRDEDGASTSGVLHALAEGLRFVRNEPVLLPLILFLAAMNLAVGPVESLLLPVYASEVFDSAVMLGIMAAALAAGSLGGNLVAGSIGHRLPRREVLLLGFLAIPLGLLALAPLPPAVVVLPVLAVVGFGLSLTNMVEYAVYFERIPGSMRARLLGITGAIGWLSVPAGRIIFGFMIERLSLGAALWSLGLVTLPIPFTVLLVRSLRSGLNTRSMPASPAE